MPTIESQLQFSLKQMEITTCGTVTSEDASLANGSLVQSVWKEIYFTPRVQLYDTY
jgi:hypothetical protein